VAKTRRGRRPQGEYAGKTGVMSFRIRPDTKAALREAATTSGRSLSQEAEHRLALDPPAPQGRLGLPSARDRGNERAEFAQSIGKYGFRSDHFHVGFVSATSVALFIASGVILSKDFPPRPVTRTVARTSSHLSPILQT
jgi:TraY domain